MNKNLELCSVQQKFLRDWFLLLCGKMGILQVYTIWKQKVGKGQSSGWVPRSPS